jgi:hypothetical protein
VAGLQQLNWDSEGVGSKAAALVDLSTVAGNKISNPPWVKFQSAGWVNQFFHQRQHTKQPSENFDCTPKNSHLPASKQALLIIIKH